MKPRGGVLVKILRTALVLLLTVACTKIDASPADTAPAGTPIDAAISDRVRDAILADSSLREESGAVHVSTQDGVVTLAGTVRSEGTRERMEVVANAVGSVVRVENRLAVDPGAARGAGTMESTVDRAISFRVRYAFENDASFAPEAMNVSVATKEGVVTLTGYVGNAALVERAGRIAAAVGSVVRVDNRLTVRTD